MPYRHAHWWVLAVLGVIVLGFWPSYWSVARTSPWQFHLHGMIATLWVVMVAAQSWTAHRKGWALHRASGQASLFLFPLLIAGLVAVMHKNAVAYGTGTGFLVPTYGPAFFGGLLVAAAAYVTLFYGALKWRRKVWSHSAFLLGTPVILFESPFSRVLNRYVPGLVIEGPQHVERAMHAILLSDALMVGLCLILWRRAKGRSDAWAIVAGFVAAQMVVMGALYFSGWKALDPLIAAVAALPVTGVVAVGLAIGGATSWLGWQAGKAPGRQRPTRSAVAA